MINIHYKTPTSKLMKMNTFNEYELNRLKKLYRDEFDSRLQRSKSTKFREKQQKPLQYDLDSAVTSSGRLYHQEEYDDTTQHIDRSNRHTNHRQSFDTRRLASQSAEQLPSGRALSPFVDPERYQRAFLNKSVGSSRIWRKSARFGRALFDFQAKSDRELSLKRGDLIEMLDFLDHTWVHVEDCQSGLRGLVPLNYIDYTVGCAVAKRDITHSQERVTRRNKVSGAIDETITIPLLTMCKGEPITLIRRLSGCWYEATNTKRSCGLVWSRDLDIIKQPALQVDVDADHIDQETNILAAEQKQQYRGSPRSKSATVRRFTESDEPREVRTNSELGFVDSYNLNSSFKNRDTSNNDPFQVRDRYEDYGKKSDCNQRFSSEKSRILVDSTNGKQTVMSTQPLKSENFSQNLDRGHSSSLSRVVRSRGQRMEYTDNDGGIDYLHQQPQTDQRNLKNTSHLSKSDPRLLGRQGDLSRFENYNPHMSSSREEYQEETVTRQPNDEYLNEIRRSSSFISSTSSSSKSRKKMSEYYKDEHQKEFHKPEGQKSSTYTIDESQYRVKHPYQAEKPDEITLVVGDEITVMHKFDDGWFIGRSNTSKQCGIFPGNFVQGINCE